jgi:hypothetical protein
MLILCVANTASHAIMQLKQKEGAMKLRVLTQNNSGNESL